jgi:hypothetical protein
MCAMYMLPFDHRESFEHGLFGWSGALTPEQTAQVTAAKRVVYDALLKAIDEGVSKDHAAVLVDEQFGHEVLADARARDCLRRRKERSGGVRAAVRRRVRPPTEDPCRAWARRSHVLSVGWCLVARTSRGRRALEPERNR